MSQFHRGSPERAAGLDDPWMLHEGYRNALPHTLRDECGPMDDLAEKVQRDEAGRSR